MLAEVVKTLGVGVFHPGPFAKARVSPARMKNEVSRARPEQVVRDVDELTIENARLRKTVLVERGRAIEAVEEARKELARGLHDGPTQLVSAIVLHLDYCKLLLEKDPSKLAEEIIAAQELASQAAHEIRTLLFELRPLALEAQGMETALRLLLERRQKEVAEGPKLIFETKTVYPNSAISRQDQKVEAAIFAIVQEAVNNALKHAQAKNVIVQLEETPTGLRTIIADDGKGFAADEVMSDYGQRCSLGIVNIRERAELIGGRLTLESAPGHGTLITVDVPKAEIVHINQDQSRDRHQLIADLDGGNAQELAKSKHWGLQAVLSQDDQFILIETDEGYDIGRRAELRNLATGESWTIVTGSDRLDFSFSADSQWALAFSTVYDSDWGGEDQLTLYVMRTADGSIREIPNTINAYFAPHSSQLAYTVRKADGALEMYVTSLDDEAVQSLGPGVLTGCFPFGTIPQGIRPGQRRQSGATKLDTSQAFGGHTQI